MLLPHEVGLLKARPATSFLRAVHVDDRVQDSLSEEKQTDEKLTKLSENMDRQARSWSYFPCQTKIWPPQIRRA